MNTSTSTRSTRKKWLGRVALMTFTTLFTLVLCEVAVRVLNLGPQIGAMRFENYRFSENPLIQYELAPGSADGDEPISGDGLRDRDFSLDKPEGVFRIAVIGDSVAYGFSIPRAESFPKRLEALLNANCVGGEGAAGAAGAAGGRKFEVMNFGVPGYNLKAIAENARTRVLKYQPDLIVYAYCLNDPQERSLEFMKLLATLTEAQKNFRFASQVEGFWVKRSRLARLAVYMSRRSTEEGKKTGGRVPSSASPENVALRASAEAEYFNELHTSGEGRANLEASLGALAAAVNEQGIPLLVAIFPATNKLSPYSLGEAHKAVADLTASHGFRSHDLLEDFRAYMRQENKGVYFDFLHPDVPGSRYTAMALLAALARESLLPDGVDADAVRVRLLAEGSEEDQLWARLSGLLDAP